MQRSVNQFRPKGDPSAPAYAPQRDLANIYLPMLREVFTSLDAVNWGPFFQAWFEREGITEDQLGEAVTMMVEAHRLFIRDREVQVPADAFAKAGADVPDVIKYALFCRLGEVVAGGFFVALRDVTMQGRESPCNTDMVEMIAAGRTLVWRLQGPGPISYYGSSPVEVAKADADEQRRLVAQLQDMLAGEQLRVSQLQAQLAAQRLLEGQAAQHTPVIAETDTVSLSWSSRLAQLARRIAQLTRATRPGKRPRDK